MAEMHLSELELSRLGDGDLDAEAREQAREHLRWCVRCRSSAAEFDWLQQEAACTLAAAAAAAPRSQPKWWDVQERLAAGRQRAVTGQRLSVIAGVVLSMLLVLSAPSVLGAAAVAQQTASPEPVVAWAPGAAVASVSADASAATPTPPVSSETVTPSPAPVSVPVPTSP